MTTHPSSLSPRGHRSRPLRLIGIVTLLAAAAALTGCTSNNSADSGSIAPDTQQIAPGEGVVAASATRYGLMGLGKDRSNEWPS